MQEQNHRRNMIRELGKKIRMARIEAQMSQLQVGVALGVSDKTISGYEAGRISISVDKLIELADLFKKPVTYFLGSDPREFKVASRLRAVEVKLREIREQLREIRMISQEKDLDN